MGRPTIQYVDIRQQRKGRNKWTEPLTLLLEKRTRDFSRNWANRPRVPFSTTTDRCSISLTTIHYLYSVVEGLYIVDFPERTLSLAITDDTLRCHWKRTRRIQVVQLSLFISSNYLIKIWSKFFTVFKWFAKQCYYHPPTTDNGSKCAHLQLMQLPRPGLMARSVL